MDIHQLKIPGRKRVSRIEIVVSILLAIASELVSPAANAMPPMSREMSGVVQQITAKTLTVLPEGQAKPLVFAWDAKSAKFVRDSHVARPDALRAGTRITIRYHSPIFGLPYVTRVFWQSNTSKSKQR